MLRIGDSDVETFMLVTLCLWPMKDGPLLDGGDRILLATFLPTFLPIFFNIN